MLDLAEMTRRNQAIVVAVILASGTVIAAAVGPILQHRWWRFERNSKTDFVIAGRVVDQMTNEGLGQANLSVAGRSENYVSEDNGNFRIELHGALPENGRARLLVTKPGYAPHDEAVMPTESLIVALKKLR